MDLEEALKISAKEGPPCCVCKTHTFYNFYVLRLRVPVLQTHIILYAWTHMPVYDMCSDGQDEMYILLQNRTLQPSFFKAPASHSAGGGGQCDSHPGEAPRAEARGGAPHHTRGTCPLGPWRAEPVRRRTCTHVPSHGHTLEFLWVKHVDKATRLYCHTSAHLAEK